MSVFYNAKSITVDGISIKSITVNNGTIWSLGSSSDEDHSEYQFVEYIETDGNQYVNTAVVASDYPDGISYVFSGNVTGYVTTSSNNYLFGCLVDGVRTGNPCVMPNSGNTALRVYAGTNSNVQKVSQFIETGVDFTFELICGSNFAKKTDIVAKLNGTNMSNSGYTFSPASMPNGNIHLFSYNGISNTGASKPYWGKLYSFTMDAVDGTPIRNFIPCYRKADGEIGLYDTVEGKFYTNSGTGSFTKGADMI